MKYIKLLQTQDQYTAFKNSADFVTPNVSYIVNTDSVHYVNGDSSNNTIEFSIKWYNFETEEVSTYVAEKDMTFSEWVASEYNTDNKIRVLPENDTVVWGDTWKPMYNLSYVQQYGSDKIIANESYYVY